MGGKARLQKIHLVRQHIVIGQIQKLVLIGDKWHCQEFQARFFRMAIGFTVIATSAGSHHVGPDIPAATGKWHDVVPG